MINKRQNSALLKELLSKQIESLSNTTLYLNDIRLKIEQNDIVALQALIQKNDIPLKQVEEQEAARLSLISSCGFEKSKEGFALCVEALDDSDHSLLELKNTLIQVKDELKIATEVNNMLVSKNKQHVQQSLHILTGAASNKAQTYSAEGHCDHDSLIRKLAIA